MKKASTIADSTLFLCVDICLEDPMRRHDWVGLGKIWMVLHLLVKCHLNIIPFEVLHPLCMWLSLSWMCVCSPTSCVSLTPLGYQAGSIYCLQRKGVLHSTEAESVSSEPWAEPSHPSTAWSGEPVFVGLLPSLSPVLTDLSLSSFQPQASWALVSREAQKVVLEAEHMAVPRINLCSEKKRQQVL